MNLIQKPRISRIVQRDKKKCNLNLSLSLSVLSRPVSRESGGIRAEDTDVHIIPVCLVSITTFWSSWYLPTIPSVSINLWRFACCYRSSCDIGAKKETFFGRIFFYNDKTKATDMWNVWLSFMFCLIEWKVWGLVLHIIGEWKAGTN